MRKATVIIGANFGDEGKGLFTDYMTSQSDEPTTVVRFNGGSQAGHTVELANGTRHVFSHFGSGTLAGAKTFLSRFFAVNPLTFMKEWSELAGKGLTPKVVIDGAAPVTTPYDMMINQIVEDARGHHRHGSCGVGFGETLARHEDSPCILTAADICTQNLPEKIIRIRDHWLPVRLEQLGVYALSTEWRHRINSDEILEAFLSCCQEMLDRSVLADGDYLKRCGSVIFEGAQGLLLDQNHNWFPHVTRSNTGLQNVVELAQAAEIDALDVVYATRAYLTRHGAGPLPFELAEKPYERIFDATNTPHPYQGTLRFAPLNFDLLKTSITDDLRFANGKLAVTTMLGVSCMDQLDETAVYIHEGRRRTATPGAMLDHLMVSMGLDKVLASFGPTRATIDRVPLYANLFQTI